MTATTTDPTRRALVVRGGWAGHVPVEATDRFIPFLQAQGYEVRVEDSPEVYTDAATMAATDLVVQCYTMGTASNEAVAGLRAAIEAGTGFAGWHGGIADSFRNTSDYLHLVGGSFACHPARDPEHKVGDQTDNYVTYTVDFLPEHADHPVIAGLDDFELYSEQYWVISDDYIDVLATTTQAARPGDPWHRPVVSPAVWTRSWGEGRVFVATPGHSLDVLDHPSVRTLIERGMLWAARGSEAPYAVQAARRERRTFARPTSVPPVRMEQLARAPEPTADLDDLVDLLAPRLAEQLVPALRDALRDDAGTRTS